MIHVIAIVTTKPGLREAVLQAFQANVPSVLAEQGCIAYEATVDSNAGLQFQTPFGADAFVVVEKWESTAALKAHLIAPHMAAYGAKVRDMISNRAIHVLSPV
jgi:quinol monooxygenase YgiN